MMEQSVREQYFALLKAYVAQSEERSLNGLSELGREMVRAAFSQEEIAELHTEALVRLTQEMPGMSLLDTLLPSSSCLVEVLMAYSQGFTQRKQAEAKLKQNAEELARSNADLEEFAYVASHDLQEPLRKIQTFSDRLLSKYNDVLDERGQDYLRRMQNAAGRMSTMIKDLLEYTRVTTGTKPFVSVDLVKVVRDVVSDLEIAIEREGGRVDIGALPTIEADPTQMRQLMGNLIDNALKFHKEGESPMVKVHAEASNGSVRITVEDNGIGFDETHAGLIFMVFQRLHGRSDYEGTGIGLAMCSKIVERHGGNIIAKSTRGQGATFMVTLPGPTLRVA